MPMKRKIWLALLAAACILGIVWCRDRAVYSYQLQGVSDAVSVHDRLYLIDNNGDENNLFMTDRNGRVLGRIDEPKLQGTWWNTYSSLTVDRDGQVYVCCYSRAMDENVGRSLAFRCDFENGRMEQVGEMTQARVNRMQAVDGMLYYYAGEAENAYGLYRMDQQGNRGLFMEMDGNGAAVKEAFYQPRKGFMWADWQCNFYFYGEDLGMEPRTLDSAMDITVDSAMYSTHRISAGESNDYAGIRINPSGAYYTDVQKGTVEHIPFGDGTPVTMFRTQDAELLDRGLSYTDVLPLYYNDDGSFLAGVDVSRGRRILGIFDRNGKQTAQLSEMVLSPEQRCIMWVRTACLCLAAGFLLYVLLGLGGSLTKGTVPITLKLFFILIPLIIGASLLLNHQLRRSLEKRLLRMNYDLLYVIADLELSEINPDDLMRMDLEKIPDDPYYDGIFKRKDYSKLPKKIYDAITGTPQPVIAGVYYWIFLEEQGELRYGEVSGRHYFGTRVDYDRSRDEIMKMNRAMETKTVVKTEYNDFTGDFVALYVPVLDADKNAVGVMESGMNRRVLDYEVEQQMAEIHKLLYLVMAVLILTVMGVLTLFLYPLIRVRDAVEDVSRGNLGRTVRVRGRDEVAGIGSAFNHMSERLREQMEFIQACSDGYAAFVPQKILEILGREDITRVRLGDQKEIEAAVLSISSQQFRENARTMSGDGLYRMINSMLHEMIPLVAREEGVVDHMKEDGLEAYYPDNCEGALQSAISICETFRTMRSRGETVPVYRACVCFGEIRLGIVGGRERMEASTISELMSLTGYLQVLGEKYGTKILILEHAAGRIPDFKKRFHSREIGTLYRVRQGTWESMYDVYDGDEPADYRAKEKTKGMFQKAVRAYRNKDYYEARLIFARILRENGKDLAAREYVYRCDRYYQTKDEGAVPPYLEEY